MGYFNKQSDIDGQIESLRRAGVWWVLPFTVGLFLVPALFTLYKAFTLHEYGLITVAAVIGFFAFGVWSSAPHVRRAIRGIDTADRQMGRIRISAEETTETVHYQAEVTVPQRGAWIFEFRPVCWTPEEGESDAECRFIPEVPWPVLVVTDQGILHPSNKPDPAEKK